MPATGIRGNVFDIQKFTVDDGPGIRTEIFMKGCPLRCKWCSNPESISLHSEVGIYPRYCIGTQSCGWCIPACKHGALIITDGKITGIDRDKCVRCLECAKSCPNDTMKIFGLQMTVDEVMSHINADRIFYEKSQGGVTFSGGDPMLQWEFMLEVLKRCKRTRIHTCVESEFHCKREHIEAIMPYTDMFITDLKHMDSAKHKEYTGIGTELIHENLRYIARNTKALVVRFPVIPGHNDDQKNIDATAKFVLEDLGGNVAQLQLLPYRPMGTDKYAALNMPYNMDKDSFKGKDSYEETITRIDQQFRRAGIRSAAGTTYPIF